MTERDPQTPQIMEVEVVNNNDFRIDDFFDGVPHQFPVGEAVTISAEAARHLFGWPGERSDMAYHMAKRFGWASREMLATSESFGKTEPKFFELASKIKIEPVYYRLERINPNAPIPADTGDFEDDARTPPPVGQEEAATATKAGKRKKTPARLAPKATARRGKAAARR